MAGIRNGPLARAYVTTAGVTELATVAPEQTWLIKAVHYVSGAGGPGRVYVRMQSSDQVVVALIADEQLDSNASATWEGWTAAGPGDHIAVSVDSPPIHVWISGADLPGTIAASSSAWANRL